MTPRLRLPAPHSISVARPHRDFGNDFRREIARVDERLSLLISKRTRFLRAYQAVTDDFESFVQPEWLNDLRESIAALEGATDARTERAGER